MTAHSPVAAPAPLAPGDLVIVYPPYEPGQVGIVVGHPRVDTYDVPGIGDIGQEMTALPERTRSLVVDVSAGDFSWRGVGDVPAPDLTSVAG